jgi:hypothetical protein
VSTHEVPTGDPSLFWFIDHNPKSSTKPLRIELRRLFEGARVPTTKEQGWGMSSLVGFGNAAAQPGEIADEKSRILRVAARASEFTGASAA